MEFTFWLNILSPHLAEVFCCLAQSSSVTVVTTSSLPKDRQGLHWREPRIEGVRWQKAEDEMDVKRICEGLREDHINIVGGLRGFPMAKLVLRELAKKRARTGIISERPDTRGLLGRFRRIAHGAYRSKSQKDVSFVLAMGAVGEQWFVDVGWPKENVFPFAYAIAPAGPNQTCCLGHRSFRLIYVESSFR